MSETRKIKVTIRVEKKAQETNRVPVDTSATPKLPTALDNLAELRRVQYATLEKLCAMLGGLTGEGLGEELARFDTGDLAGLLGLTRCLAEQGKVIDALLAECRALMGL